MKKKWRPTKLKQVSKPFTYRSKKYLDYIKRKKCLACQKGIITTEPHHVSIPGSGRGVGKKGSDYHTIPLCRNHHRSYHYNGRESFCEDFNIHLEREIIRLNQEYIAALEGKQ